jgi:hypothetical protein
MAAKKPTRREIRFLDLWYQCLYNGSEAMRQMGVHRNARQKAHLILRQAHIKAEVKRRDQALKEQHEGVQELTIRTTAYRANPNLLQLAEWNGDGLRLVSSDDLPKEAGYQIAKVRITTKTRRGENKAGIPPDTQNSRQL